MQVSLSFTKKVIFVVIDKKKRPVSVWVSSSKVIPYCLSLICAYAIVILLVVCLQFSIHTAQGCLSLFHRLTRRQTTLICVSFYGELICLAYEITRGSKIG